jgi:hypothetical protein
MISAFLGVAGLGTRIWSLVGQELLLHRLRMTLLRDDLQLLFLMFRFRVPQGAWLRLMGQLIIQLADSGLLSARDGLVFRRDSPEPGREARPKMRLKIKRADLPPRLGSLGLRAVQKKLWARLLPEWFGIRAGETELEELCAFASVPALLHLLWIMAGIGSVAIGAEERQRIALAFPLFCASLAMYAAEEAAARRARSRDGDRIRRKLSGRLPGIRRRMRIRMERQRTKAEIERYRVMLSIAFMERCDHRRYICAGFAAPYIAESAGTARRARRIIGGLYEQ